MNKSISAPCLNKTAKILLVNLLLTPTIQLVVIWIISLLNINMGPYGLNIIGYFWVFIGIQFFVNIVISITKFVKKENVLGRAYLLGSLVAPLLAGSLCGAMCLHYI